MSTEYPRHASTFQRWPAISALPAHLGIALLGLALLGPVPLAAQSETTAEDPKAAQETQGTAAETVRDLPVPPDRLHWVAGEYSVTVEGSEGPPRSFRFYAENGFLVGQIAGNSPTRMLYQGGTVFRPQAAPTFVVTFLGEGDRASGLEVESPGGPMRGVRIAEVAADSPSPSPAPQPVPSPSTAAPSSSAPSTAADPSTSGPLFDELAAMDRKLFDASFAECAPEKLPGLVTADLEFYHDQTGPKYGQEAIASLQQLAESCPGKKGVTRSVIPNSLRVYPIEDFGAVQMGLHHFVENGNPSSTIARFVHLWKKVGDGWRVSRVLSFDHRSVVISDGER